MLERLMRKAADITLDIDPGDILLGGKFKNSPITVKEFGTDENGQPTVNDKKLLAMRIKKEMPGQDTAEEPVKTMFSTTDKKESGMKYTREQIVAALRKAAELKRITAELGCTDNGCVMSSEGVSDIGPDDPDFQVPFDDNGDPMAVPVNGRVQASAFDVMRGRKNAGRYPVMVHPDEDGYIDEDARFDAMHKSYLPEDGLPADFFMDNVRDHDNTDAAITHYMDNSPVSREYESIRRR